MAARRRIAAACGQEWPMRPHPLKAAATQRLCPVAVGGRRPRRTYTSSCPVCDFPGGGLGRL
eukprot:1384600-Prorocentrum_lima.AAC.1